MKKGTKLTKIEISKSHIAAYCDDGTLAKLSRTERNVLSNYKNASYVENIKKVFGNPDILSSEFVVIKDGKTKFTYTK